MYQIDFKNTDKCIHFIGIGGISMSGLAELLLHHGFRVSGSDSKSSELTEKLETLGARISYPQAAENIADGIDVIVMTAAIRENNPELMAARAKALPVLTRAELLGQVMKHYSQSVAISGTHGKTTTTSMASELLMSAGMDPTLSIGGILPSIGGNFRIGGSEHFITEACEYTNSFLSLYPKIEIILNIDADHLDFFKDLADIRASFARFAALLPEDGTLIINGSTDKIEEITAPLKCKVITFGLSKDYDYGADNFTYDKYARPTFTLYKKGVEAGSYTLGVTGEHNICNALSVIAYADLLGIDDEITKAALQHFTGTDRRFQLKGEHNGYTILDDYAHHPTEIAATLNTANNYPHENLWCVFQPHTYTRTKALLDDFAKALSIAQHVILPDIYAARETDTLGVSSQNLADKINALGGDAIYLGDFAKIEEFIEKNLSTGDLLITMGAGDVVKIGENLLSK